MRTASLLLAALALGAAGLALTPPAAAADYPCMTGDLCLDPPVEPHCPAQSVATSGDSVDVNPDCSVDIETGKDIVCVGAWTATDEHDVGPVHWTRHYCAFPGGDPVCCLESAAAIGLPDPCGPTALCEGPSCTLQELVTEGLPVTVGVRVDGGCRVFVAVTDPYCPKPTQPGGDVHTDGIVSVWAETCQASVDCTCDPLPIDPTVAAPACPEKGVSTTQFFGFIGPHVAVAVHSDCTVDVAEFGLPCPSFAPNRGQFDRTVGRVHVEADTCVPELDCTCPPLAVAAAAIPPPVEVEWVVCVTEPCDSPRITCHVGPRDLPGFDVEVSESCHVTVTQDPLACEGMTYESTTVGQVTVRRAYCGPGIDP